jgi:hypothetical protein
VHGIDGDEGAGEAEFGEQGLHRRNFVRLLVTVEMRQHQRCIRRERAQNMCGLAVLEMVEAATQCLAVDGDMALPLVAGLRVENGGVTSEYLLHRRWIQLLENEADRAVGRRAPPRQHEKVAQPDEMDIDEAVNCTVRVGPGQHGQYGEQHDVRETVKLAFRASRVFDLGKQGEKRGQRRHGNLGASESGCPSKSQRFQSAGIPPPMAKHQSPKVCDISDSPVSRIER